MNLKETLRVFVIVMIGLTIVVLLLLYFSGSFDSNKIPSSSELILTDGTKFPIESYVFQTKANKKIDESLFESEEVVEEEDIEESFNNLKKELESVKYTKDIFPNKEKKGEDREEKERKRLLSLRLTPISNNVQKNNFSVEKEKKLDYGDNRFDNLKVQDKSSHETKLYRAITADRMIPAVLINAIHSSLEGKVTAQIEDDIYSSLGKTLLIPKGSRAIGFYQNNNRIGENRLRLVWQRIITPYGNNIILTKAQSADILGNSGIVGVINNRYWERYGMPLALSTLTNSVLLLISQSQNENNTNTQIVLDNSRQDLGYIMKNIIDEQVKINPTIEVRAGSRIFINPTQDIWFPKPKENEIIVQYFDKENS